MNSGKYLHDILDSVKDEPTVLKKLSETIVRYANMSEKELAEQKYGEYHTDKSSVARHSAVPNPKCN